jgi:hypothetical protein
MSSTACADAGAANASATGTIKGISFLNMSIKWGI